MATVFIGRGCSIVRCDRLSRLGQRIARIPAQRAVRARFRTSYLLRGQLPASFCKCTNDTHKINCTPELQTCTPNDTHKINCNLISLSVTGCCCEGGPAAAWLPSASRSYTTCSCLTCLRCAALSRLAPSRSIQPSFVSPTGKVRCVV
jgi:hypothetical protein